MICKISKALLLMLVLAVLTLPVSLTGIKGGNPLIHKAHAVSAKSMPLGSNIFVEIAKKAEPGGGEYQHQGEADPPGPSDAPIAQPTGTGSV